MISKRLTIVGVMLSTESLKGFNSAVNSQWLHQQLYVPIYQKLAE